MKRSFLRWLAVFAAIWVGMPSLMLAQVVVIFPPRLPPRTVPTPTPIRQVPDFRVKSVDVNVSIKDQAAKVQLSQVFQNTSSVTVEAQLVFPVPENAAITGLTLMVDGKELTGKLMKKEEAKQTYEAIVRRRQDPALLEYVGQGLYQTSVFPIPPQGERAVEIRYNELLKKDNGLVDLMLPLGTFKHSNKAIDALNVTIRVETAEQIKTIYSPTHQLDIQRPDNNHAVCKVSLKNVLGPDDLRLFHGTVSGLVGMNVLSYRPQENEDGYFLLLASPDFKPTQPIKIDRSLVFVCDRSGSMSGQKMEQMKQALKFLIQQLKPGDTFNIVAYDSNVESFRPELQRVDDATIKAAMTYADGLYAGGSTNIDGALQASLKMLKDTKRPSYVLFLTDGVPTVGEMDEQKIAANAKHVNIVNARLFAFGVGYDVNARLLDRLSSGQRGHSIYVKPSENIEAHVSNLYNKIGSPVLTDLGLAFDFDHASTGIAHINRSYPRQLTDLFQGEQLVYVGRYKTSGNAKVTLTGSLGSDRKTFSFTTELVKKSPDESLGFVEKLWAARRIGEIIEEIDLRGQNKELIDELVQLSMKHGIITPYTSFLADENVHLADLEGNRARASGLATQDLGLFEGKSAVSQRRAKQRLQSALSPALTKAGGEETGIILKAERDALVQDSTRKRAIANGRVSGNRGNPSGGISSKPNGRNSEFETVERKGKDLSGIVGDLEDEASEPKSGTSTGRLDASSPGKIALYEDANGHMKAAAAVRNLGQKTFFRKGDIWRDSTVTEEQAKKAIRIKQFSREYFDLAAKHGRSLSKYLTFSEPVLLNFEGKTYQIDPADPQP